MLKNKIKILATLSIIAFVAFLLTFSPRISVNADKDELVKEISEYKSWGKVNIEPLRVELNITLDGADV